MLVVNGRVVACAERVPARVIGDGTRSVRELIEAANRDPRRGIGHTKILTHLPMDEQTERYLSSQGRTLDSVPAADEEVFLRQTANLSTGGTSIDRTEEMHPDNKTACEMAAAAVGLDVAGVDVMTEDISVAVPRERRGDHRGQRRPRDPDAHASHGGHGAQRRGADRRHAVSAGRRVDDPGDRGDGHERQDHDDAPHRAPVSEQRADGRLHDDRWRVPAESPRDGGGHDRPLRGEHHPHEPHRGRRGAGDGARRHPARGARLRRGGRGRGAERVARSPRPARHSHDRAAGRREERDPGGDEARGARGAQRRRSARLRDARAHRRRHRALLRARVRGERARPGSRLARRDRRAWWSRGRS